MKTRSFLAAVPGLLLPAVLAAQVSPNTVTNSDDFESHVVERGTAVWFGKSKNKILDYAAVTTRTGIVKTDHRTAKRFEEDTTRYELSVVVNTSDSSTATAKAKVRKVIRYTETSSAFDILVELKTGIEGSSTGFMGSQTILSAMIATSLVAGAEWALHLETNIDSATSNRHRQGSLQNDSRVIEIIDSRFPHQGTGPATGFGIEFIENGKLLGSIGDGVYLFSRNLDPDLKLVLAAAMETVSFRLMQ